ncbi:Isonitrile hydratase [Dyadobacter sp. CECT 9623]|uniref:Isonitrile hydratase n=1 Tax=Dyadobacter linearis TaxID=2823330 RepID=A0ABM8UYL1_9BACT|nr:DJ-1/PfpI family protein [Dyadobacter sp. CECT 9623]CAG5074768.1 Isonitrile hydratase [Dyadobacter sp. CECT 9623]
MKIGILLYDQVTALDIFGPLDILARVKDWDIKVVACTPGRIDIGNGLFVEPSSVLTKESEFDVLLIPGGRGHAKFHDDINSMEIIRAVCGKSRFILTVCTGSIILGSCGLLEGIRATTNRAAFQSLERLGAIVVNERIVEDGNVFSCGGVTAGIDLAFYFINKIEGADEARRIQLLVEYNPAPLYDYKSLEMM